MKKMNDKGFLLAETLIVATFLATTLLFLYIQLNNVVKSYYTSFKYNTANSLYAANNIVDYITSDGLDKLKTDISSNNYINITNCPNNYFKETNYCEILFDSLKVKTAIFTKEDLTDLKKSNIKLDQTMVDFINYIDYEKNDSYRVIVEFKDNTFASLRIKK